MKTKILISMMLAFVCFITVKAQVLSIDLANAEKDKKNELSYDFSTISTIELLNVNPYKTRDYLIKYEVINVLPDPYDLPDGTFASESKKEDCKSFKQALEDAIKYADTDQSFNEKTWKSEHLDNLKEYVSKNECDDSDLKDQANQIIFESVSYLNLNDKPIKIRQGQELNISVTRGSGDAVVSWQFVVKGKPAGQWITHYGFGFAAPMNKLDTYYAKSNPDTTTFTVAKNQTRGQNMSYLPSVMFSYIPYQGYNKPVNFSITGGIGANTENVAFLFGGSMIFRQFLSLTGHIVGQNQDVLLGKYNEDGTSIIAESLTFEQLHEKKFKLHWGFTLGFRFSENPFGKSGSEKEKTEE